MRRLGCLVALVVLLAPIGGRAMHPLPHTTVYAHRGGAALYPENTLGAFRAAHTAFGDLGVWLELDIQLTADAQLVVIHDATLDRTTDCWGNVIGMTAEQLQGCDARDGWSDWPTFEPVPTLRAVLAEGKAAGWRLMVELKNIPGEPNFELTGAAAAAELLALVEETGFPPADLLVQSFFPTSLDQIELGRPEIATALLTTSQLPGAPPGVGFTLLENAAYATARGYEVSAPDHAAADLTPEGVATAHALGRGVVVWTVNDPADISRVRAAGVDGIISDRPDLAYQA